MLRSNKMLVTLRGENVNTCIFRMKDVNKKQALLVDVIKILSLVFILTWRVLNGEFFRNFN